MIIRDFAINVPEAYIPVDSHRARLANLPGYERAVDLEAKVPAIAEAVGSFIVERLGYEGRSKQVVIDSLQERADGIAVFRAPHAQSQGGEVGGYFDTLARSAVINTSCGLPEAEVFPHEITHGLFVAGLATPTYLASDNKAALNGLHSIHTNFKVGMRSPLRELHSGIWISEALNEHVRTTVFDDAAASTYRPELVTIRTLFAVIDGLEEAALESAFITANKARLWGLIENKFGPFWVETADNAFTLMRKGADEKGKGNAAFVAILNAIPEGERKPFLQVMRSVHGSLPRSHR